MAHVTARLREYAEEGEEQHRQAGEGCSLQEKKKGGSEGTAVAKARNATDKSDETVIGAVMAEIIVAP